MLYAYIGSQSYHLHAWQAFSAPAEAVSAEGLRVCFSMAERQEWQVDVEYYYRSWGMAALANGYQLTAEYLDHLRRDSGYVTTLQTPFVWGGRSGCIVLASTGQSTWQQQQNRMDFQLHGSVFKPHWFEFDVYFFQGMALMNFAGMHSQEHQGRMIGRAEDVFTQALASMGKAGRLAHYTLRQGGWYLESLREILTKEFNQHVWVEFTIGNSYMQYNCLDLYLRVMNMLAPIPTSEAWYVLNSFKPVWNRLHRPRLIDWWMYHDLVSYGQKWVVDEYFYEVTGVMAPADVSSRIYAIQDGGMSPSPRTLMANALRVQRMVEQWAREHKASLEQRAGILARL